MKQEWRGVRPQIARLTQRYGLPDDCVARLQKILEVIASDPGAPSSVRDPRAAVDAHLADSLVGLELAEVRNATLIADLGAGAGFPGLPLAVAKPSSEVALVESNRRRCQFIEKVVAACGLANAHAVHARAESWAAGIARHDLVTARAVGPLETVIEYAAPLLVVGGALVVWRGRRDARAEQAAGQAAAQLGLEVREPVAVKPYREAQYRHLHLMLKVSTTPPGFPRRPGMARKRPLGHQAPTV